MSERNARLLLDEGWSLLAAGQTVEAAKRADASGADAVASGMLRGLCCYAEGRDHDAAAAWRDVLKRDPQNPVAALYLPLALYRSGEVAEAARALTNKNLVILPHRGWLAAFLELFWPLRATIHAEAPVSAPPPDPFSTDYSRWKSAMEGAQGNLAASRSFERASSRLATRYHGAALRLYEKIRLAEAAPLFCRAAEIAPRNEEFAVHAAFISLLAGRVDAAEGFIAPFIGEWISGKQMEGLPHPDVLAVHAWVLHERGDYKGSLAVIGCIHPEGPDDWGGHFLAAINWLMLEDRARFREALDHALSAFFIDTWEQLLRPFVHRTQAWLSTKT